MAKRLKVHCPVDGDNIINAETVVLDDEEAVYRFTCKSCGEVVSKHMDERIRTLLRSAGVATIDELVESASVQLIDDRNIWRALL